MAIRWEWDGKTVTLVNDEPATYHDAHMDSLPTTSYAKALLDAAGRASSDKEREALMRGDNDDVPVWSDEGDFRSLQEKIEDLRNTPNSKEKRKEQSDSRKAQMAFYKYLKGGGTDVAAGMQELIDAGIITEEEEGFGATTGIKSSKAIGAMVRAHDAYVGWMKDQGNTQYDPRLGGWYNPNVGAPMIRDSQGNLIIRDPSGQWHKAYQ